MGISKSSSATVANISADTDTIQAVLSGAVGIPAFPSSAAPANDVSLAEVLRDLWDAVRNGTGGAEPGTNTSIVDILSGAGGIVTFPAAAVAANAVSMAEVLRYIQEVSNVQILTRAAATTPQTGAEALFTITGGNIELLSIVGEVTTVLETNANNTKLTYNPTGAGTSSDICAVLDTTTAAVGIMFTIAGTFATALGKGAQNFISKTASPATMAAPITMGPGTIDLDCAASRSGEIQWTIGYRKLEAASVVVTA